MTEPPNEIRRWQWATIALGILVGMVVWASFDPIQQINDAAQYASSARNLRDRGEFATSCIFYGEHYAFGSIPAPQTVFPPGYPALMAGASRLTGVSLRTVGFGINLVCFVGSGWVLFSLCRRLGSRADIAFFCSGCWLLTNIMWHATWLNLSEPSFTLFALLGVRLLLQPGWRFVVSAGLCAAGAITIRYVGVLLVFGVVLNHFVFSFRARDRKPFIHAVLFAIPSAVALIAMFARNAALSGSMRGGNDYQMAEPLNRVALRLAASLGRIFGLNRHVLDDTATAVTAVVAGLCLAFGVVWFLIARKQAVATRIEAEPTPGSWLMVSFPVIYVVSLFVLEYTTGSGLTDRLVTPILPFLFAGVARFISHSGTPSRTMLGAAAGLAIGFGSTQVFVHNRLVEEAPPSHLLSEVLQAELASERQPLNEFLLENINEQHPLLCNEPQLVQGLLKRPVVSLPTRRYNTGPEWSEQRVLSEVLEPYDVQFVLLAKGPRLVTEDSPLFFQQLSKGEVGSTMRLVSDTDTYALFEVAR